MRYHVFVLVWGEPFARAHLDMALPFLMMPGNLPSLAADAEVDVHIYTDRETKPLLEEGTKGLGAVCRRNIHVLEDIHVRGASPLDYARGIDFPEYKYAVQRECVRHLHDSVKDQAGASIIFLDSNFLLSDGTLAALDERRRQGFEAAAVNVLRLSEGGAGPLLTRALAADTPVGARELVAIGLKAPHHFTEAFYVDAGSFTPYPSQLIWRLGDDGMLSRAFLPHPLMAPVGPAMAHSQSTMDYDMALRSAPDDKIYVAADSDEMLICKISGDAHQSERNSGPPPTAQNLALFLLSSTNRRHRLFADIPIYFHAGERHQDYKEIEAESGKLVGEAYDIVDTIAGRAGELDASAMIYVKSFFGPIEEYMSPQLEPDALDLLRQLSETK
ncbi:MAG: hypothetical protein QGH73_10750 [Rhodospirillales bacterium]|jgi:hypothetical protein|nr:hypothetical protein [Rhodospirillaceae bacterium]MDP6426471.1 hypothetical protein [Rhodospirillales bacterium]MDP6643004.1 hypothetical protein [Rhodospirillales bacterium]MDP6842147.1 hypothetical protein [Rhodospirillales bacterium]